MFKIDRDKYIDILKAQGVNAAVTALHNDVAAWEYESFEGPKGWQPGMWRELEEIRVFSRELWDLGLSQSRTSGGTI
jgi:hypothetical protein